MNAVIDAWRVELESYLTVGASGALTLMMV
jgi:hypothetical protein